MVASAAPSVFSVLVQAQQRPDSTCCSHLDCRSIQEAGQLASLKPADSIETWSLWRTSVLTNRANPQQHRSTSPPPQDRARGAHLAPESQAQGLGITVTGMTWGLQHVGKQRKALRIHALQQITSPKPGGGGMASRQGTVEGAVHHKSIVVGHNNSQSCPKE